MLASVLSNAATFLCGPDPEVTLKPVQIAQIACVQRGVVGACCRCDEDAELEFREADRADSEGPGQWRHVGGDQQAGVEYPQTQVRSQGSEGAASSRSRSSFHFSSAGPLNKPATSDHARQVPAGIGTRFTAGRPETPMVIGSPFSASRTSSAAFLRRSRRVTWLTPPR